MWEIVSFSAGKPEQQRKSKAQTQWKHFAPLFFFSWKWLYWSKYPWRSVKKHSLPTSYICAAKVRNSQQSKFHTRVWSFPAQWCQHPEADLNGDPKFLTLGHQTFRRKTLWRKKPHKAALNFPHVRTLNLRRARTLSNTTCHLDKIPDTIFFLKSPIPALLLTPNPAHKSHPIHQKPS